MAIGYTIGHINTFHGNDWSLYSHVEVIDNKYSTFGSIPAFKFIIDLIHGQGNGLVKSFLELNY